MNTTPSVLEKFAFPFIQIARRIPKPQFRKDTEMARALSHSIIRISPSLSHVSKSSSGYIGGGIGLSFQNYHYIPSDSSSFQFPDSSSSSLSPETAKKIEDAIHGIIVKRSAPAWLPFVPGTSYWVPPRRPGCDMAQMLHKAHSIKVNAHEELMSVKSTRGWPSSVFYTEEGLSEPVDEAEPPPSSVNPSADIDE